MTMFEDLKPCEYFPFTSNKLLAVGWLNRNSRFETGKVSIDFFHRLCKLAKYAWQPLVSPGLHTCDLCQFEQPGFTSNIFIPYNGAIYVAPEGIIHYISAQWYKPPEIFIKADFAAQI